MTASVVRFWHMLAAAVVLGLVVAASPAISADEGGYGKQRVVYHINDLDQAKAALRNVKNHLNALGDENVEVVVVTHSKGGLALVDGQQDSRGNTFDSDIQALANRGVRFQICNNTIEGLKIDRNQINLNTEVVESGVAQLAKLQQEGFVYIKP